MCILLLPGGCIPDLAIDPGADIEISCRPGEADCPDGFICSEALARCVVPGADQDPPAVSGSVTLDRDLIGPGATATISFTVTEPLGTEPAVRLEWAGDGNERPCVLSSESGLDYRFTYTATVMDPDVVASLVIELNDAAGNPGRLDVPRVLTLDSQAPTVVAGTQAVLYEPDPVGNVLRVVDAAAPGTTIVILFALNELTDTSTPVSARLTAFPQLTFTERTNQGTFYIFELLLPSMPALASGGYDVEIYARDLAGNDRMGAFVDAGIRVAVDTTNPADPDNSANTIVYRRNPWGTADSGGTVVFSLEGSANAVDAGTTVIAYDGPDPATASEIGRVDADTNGAFGALSTGGTPFELNRVDRAQVFVASADSAGNLSTAVPVERAQWLASFGNVSAGLNPHSVSRNLTSTLPPLLDPAAAPAFPVELESLEPMNAGSLAARSEWPWRFRNTLAPDPLALGNAVYRSSSGEVVSFGGVSDNLFNRLWVLSVSNWLELNPSGAAAPSRAGHGMAYDPFRDRVVVFGGQSSGQAYLGDTWEFDGTRWQNLTASAGEPLGGRSFVTMSFDSNRNVIVLFGGGAIETAMTCSDGSSPIMAGMGTFFCVFSDTWEYDGMTWTKVCDLNSVANCGGQIPAARFYPAMAFDPIRGVTVLHGGCPGLDCSATLPADEELWEYDGSWTRPATVPVPRPPNRHAHAMTYDSVMQEVVLTTGCTGTEFFDCFTADALDATLWHWNGTRWTSVTPGANAPSPRAGAWMTFDTARGKAVLYGGTKNLADLPAPTMLEPPYPCGDGTFLTPGFMGVPSNSCEPNGGANAESSCACYFGQVWEWASPAGPWTRAAGRAALPDSRKDAAVAYDAAGGQSILFGGDNRMADCEGSGTSTCHDTWTWDGAGWTQTPFNVATDPPTRQAHMMAYDRARDKVILFGGDPSGPGFDNDTWEWDATNGWVDACAAYANACTSRPAPRMEGALSSFAMGVVLYGGCLELSQGVAVREDCEVATNDLWIFAVSASCATMAEPCWRELSPDMPLTDPLPRSGHAMAYDVRRDMVVMHGGEYCDPNGIPPEDMGMMIPGGCDPMDGLGPAMAPRDDFCELDNNLIWTCTALGAGQPTTRAHGTMSYDASRGRILLFGGAEEIFSGGGGANDLWEYDGTQWLETTPTGTLPDTRRRHSFVYMVDQQKALLFSGTNESADTWELDLSPGIRPALLVDFAWANAQVTNATLSQFNLTLDVTATGYTTDLADGIGDPMTGTEVYLYDTRRQVWEVQAQPTPCVPRAGGLDCTITNPQDFVFAGDNHIYVLLRPVAGAGNGDAPAEIVLEHIELAVDYRL